MKCACDRQVSTRFWRQRFLELAEGTRNLRCRRRAWAWPCFWARKKKKKRDGAVVGYRVALRVILVTLPSKGAGESRWSFSRCQGFLPLVIREREKRAAARAELMTDGNTQKETPERQPQTKNVTMTTYGRCVATATDCVIK
jgi:hypothetical protein